MTEATAATVATAVTGSAAGGARRVLVVGGGGGLGTAVVEQLLAAHRFGIVGVWTVGPLQAAMRRLAAVPEADWDRWATDTALIVFDRARHANGRDDAFGRPDPAALPTLAARLRAAGATTLVVVVPHAPGLLPQALKAGIASLDEGAVAGLGFARLVFMRAAQGGGDDGVVRAVPARLARWLLSQLRWMVAQRDQPVRTATVARVAARLAAALPQAAPGTRVMPPELLWAAAQRPGDDSVVDAWLQGQPLPAAVGPRQRW